MKFKMGGSGIHIKPENRGKFTATKKATGKTTEELTHSKNPLTRKRAIFAQNAAKWKHEDGSKSMKVDKKMCGSKGMKYQVGGKSIKATPDSTNYFKKKIIEESFKRSRGKFSGFNEENSKIDRKINKLGEDIDRQELKGKPGYDANGYPLKKGVKKSSGASGDFANGTKSIKFKKPMMKRADGSTSQRGLWDNIRANKGSGKKPTPEMLKQEKKIKAGK
jgi:hypothetical protein